MNDYDIKIELTGNPFVDTGIAVISSLKGLDDVTRLTLADIRSVYRDGSQITEWNSKLKTFTQIFGTNNPLFQPSYGFKKGKGPSETNKAIYKSTLEGLLSGIDKIGNGPRCWACGSPSDFDFAKSCKKAVEDNEKKVPEDKWIGRDWFPLAGSLGSDAQALPAASKPPHICPKCLFVIHYLPMGLLLLDGRLAVFQSTAVEFWYELVQDIVNEVKVRIESENYETLGSKEDSRAIMRRLMALFERLQKERHYDRVPEGTSLYIWRFSNSGASPECMIEEIPNPSLTFLWDAVQDGLRSDIESLVGSEGKNPRYSLFRCILDRRDYPNLYPKGKKRGASSKLFALYQVRIRRHSSKALQIAFKLAKEVAEEVSEKDLKRLQRPEAFKKEEKLKNQFRASMVRMAEKGELTIEDYLNLFPIKDNQGVTAEWDGWNLIRFYLYHTNEDDEPKSITATKDRPIPNFILYYAGAIYNHYISEKGRDRFQREVLGQMKLDKIRGEWLKNQFVKLAEYEDGFTYGHWSRLCKLDNGIFYIPELLYQMRLLWSQWMHEGRMSVDISKPAGSKSTNGLSMRISTLIETVFTDYVDRRGLDRFQRDVLLKVRRKEIGFFWFKERLTKQISKDVQPLTAEEWEEFLVDDEGQSIKAERLFQIHLTLANLYRIDALQREEVTK